MRIGLRWFLILGIAAFAACSQAPAPPAIPALASSSTHPAAAPTPMQYVYTANYSSNDVSQVALYPAKPYLKTIAHNFALPAGCANPDALAFAKGLPLLFVSCYSGEIVALAVNPKTHVLSASKIQPVPVASPLALIAPTTGAAGQLYADGYNGQLYQLSYTSKSLALHNTYTTTSVYPDQMAFYTNPSGVSTLFVAAPYDTAQCGSGQSGDIVPWQQNADGSLVEQTVIPACTPAFQVTVAGSTLYWASESYLGAYSLTANATLPVPTPPWAATQGGPSYYPKTLSALATAGNAKARGRSDEFTILSVGADGYITFYNASGKVTLRVPIVTQNPNAEASICTKYANGVLLGGKAYANLCWIIEGDNLTIQGVTKEGKKVEIAFIHPGSQPYDLEIAPISL